MRDLPNRLSPENTLDSYLCGGRGMETMGVKMSRCDALSFCVISISCSF